MGTQVEKMRYPARIHMRSISPVGARRYRRSSFQLTAGYVRDITAAMAALETTIRREDVVTGLDFLYITRYDGEF